MSAIGVDLGNSSIRICKWNADTSSASGVGAESVESNRGQRAIPARLNFKGLLFNVCDQRSANIIINFANYIWGYKSLIGSNDHYSATTSEKAVISDTGRATFPITYNNIKYQIDSETALSIILQYVYYRSFKADSISYDEFPMKMDEVRSCQCPVAISIPVYYSDSNVRGLEAALALSQLGTVTFVPENVAVALEYGYFKAQHGEFPGKGRIVLFCEMGTYCTALTLVHFTNEGMTILESKYDVMGSKDVDLAVAKIIRKQAGENLDMEIPQTAITEFKLRSVAEKVKQDLSASGADDATYLVERIVDDEDAEGLVTKEDMEIACKEEGNLIDRFYHFVFTTIEECASDLQIDVVEMSGSGMRVPLFRTKLLEAVQHSGQSIDKISNTLNMEEACSRGCALFAQKYLVEKEIVCMPEQVVVKTDTKEITMDVCGYKPMDPVQGKFVISSTVSLPKGTDHDWTTILKDGSDFIQVFIKNSTELHMCQKARQELEVSFRELQNFVNTCSSNPKLQEQCATDRDLLAESERYVISAKMLPVNEYNDWTKRLNKRIASYHSTLNVSTCVKVFGDYKYEGVWLGHRMNGVYHRYTLDDVLISCGEYKNGCRHGVMTYYYPSGAVKEIATYRDNKRSGKRQLFFEDGQLAKRVEYENDQITGYWQKYYPNGQLLSEGLVKDGKNVFQNTFYTNGVIQIQKLYDEYGHLRVSYEFDRKGELVYEGRIRKGNYDGRSVLYFQNQFYAYVLFDNGQLISHNEIVPKGVYQRATLIKQYKETQELDRTYIHWKPIRVCESEIAHVKSRVLKCGKTSHLVSEISSLTAFEIMKESNGDDIHALNEEGYVYQLSKEEIMKKALYDSDIREFTWKKYTLFGDLKSYSRITESETNEKEITRETFYPVGRREVVLNDPASCRKRKVEVLKDGEANGHCVEYYNNGMKSAEGEKADGVWVTVKRYLNTGKEIV